MTCGHHIIIVRLDPRPAELDDPSYNPDDAMTIHERVSWGLWKIGDPTRDQRGFCDLCDARTFVGVCPACSGPLIYTDSKTADDDDATYFEASCEAGCSPAQIEQGLVEVVRRREAKQRDEIVEAARQRAIASNGLRRLRSAPPVQKWIVPGVVPAGMLTLKIGDSGARKTFDSMHKALCVASGTAWYGRPVEQGVAMLVLLEGGDTQLNRYLDGIARGIGVDVDALMADGALDVYPEHLNVDDDESWAKFVRRVELLKPKWIAIDNLNSCRARQTQGAGNDTALTGAIMGRLAGLVHGGKAGGIELLHHVNARGESSGAKASENKVDVEFKMKAASKSNDALITMELTTKNRAGAGALQKMQIRYVDRDFVDDGTGNMVPTTIVPTEVEPKAPKSITPEKDADPRREAVRKALAEKPSNNRSLREELGWSFRTLSGVLGAMETDGEIERVSDLWHLVGADD